MVESGTWGGETSCVELEGQGSIRILCDAGSGLRRFGNEILANAPTGKHEFHIFISHLHWDHIMGLPFFVPAYVPGNRIVIHSCHEVVEDAVRKQWGLPGFPVRFEDLGAELEFVVHEVGNTFEVGPYTISTIKQHHGGDSYGYRFEGFDRSVVYSTDSEHKDVVHGYPFVDFFKDADLVIFDAQYSLAETLSVKEDWGHSSNVVGVELAKRAGVKRLCLFHHEPNCDDGRLQQIVNGSIRYEEILPEGIPDHHVEILSARDGLVLDI